MVANGGHRAIVPLLADKDRSGRSIAHLAVRRIDLDPAKMRVHGEIGHGVDLGKRNIGVREALEHELGPADGEQPPVTCIGMFESGRSDLSELASRDVYEPPPFR